MGSRRTHLIRFGLVLVVAAALAGVMTAKAEALAFIQDDPCRDTLPLFVCPDGTVGASYSITFKGSGGCGPALPYQYRILNGALPPGLTLSSGGTISGSPTQSGTWRFWVELSDQDPPSKSWCLPAKADREFEIEVLAGISINQQSAKPGTLGQAYSEQLTATLLNQNPPPSGSPLATAAWSVQSGTLPPGITLSATGLLSGTPTAEGDYQFVVRAQLDASRFDTETLTLPVRTQVEISAPAIPKSEVGVAYKHVLTVKGGSGTYTWTLEGSLPDGVTFDTTTATFSGTPREAGAFSYTATATDQQGRVGTFPGRILVAQRIAITRPTPKPAKVGRLWKLKLKSTGGVLPRVWKLKKGPLPKGIKFDRTLGLFSGTPTKAGRYRITVELTDVLKAKSTMTFVIVVSPSA